jgi:hypothetical protein
MTNMRASETDHEMTSARRDGDRASVELYRPEAPEFNEID